MKHLILTFSIILFGMNVYAQNSKNGTEEVKIKTSAQCGMCKSKLEKEISYVKGVKKVSLDIESKTITVKYDTKKTDVGKIKDAISKTGYDADELMADEKAYNKLAPCCKKDGGH
jgi:periplasmic mercuric ion binding protein